MRKFRTAAAVALALLYCGPLVAETFTDFPVVIQKKTTATDNEIEGGFIPLVKGTGNTTRKIPGEGMTRNSAVQTLTNKTIDCAENNCVNFPTGANESFVPPTVCTVEGELYNNNGTLALCHLTTVAGGIFLLNGGGGLALNGGGVLALNP